MKKYLVRPGYVRSRADDDLHFIGASALMRLYGVPPSECYVVRSKADYRGLPKGLKVLQPSSIGNYQL